MRIWSKIRIHLGWSKFVSAYMERDKKIMKLAVFGVQVAVLLIDFFRRRSAVVKTMARQVYTDFD